MLDKSAENAGHAPTQSEAFDESMAIPASRLDADHYAADDIDGVTESIFGSGNMAYASLQASQVDDAMALNDALNPESDSASDRGDLPTFSGNMTAPDSAIGNAFHAISEPDREIPTDTDRALDSGDMKGTENLGAEGNFSNTTVGALSASTLSSDIGAFSGASGLASDGGVNIDITGSSAVTNSTVTNNNPTTITDTVNTVLHTVNDTVEVITNVLGDTIGDVTTVLGDTIGEVTNLGGDLVETVTNMGNEIVENILQGDIESVVNTITNGLTQEISNITETLNSEVLSVTDTVTNTVTNLLEETGVTDMTSQITNTVFNSANDITTAILGDGGISAHLDTGLLNALGAHSDITIDDSISGTIGAGLVPDNVSALTDSLTGLDVPALPETGLDVSFDLLGGTDPDDGADLSVAGLDTPDIALDPVEALVGDIDVNADAGKALDTDARLLIVDDHPVNRLFMRRALEGLGFDRFDEAASGAQAIALFEQTR